MATEIEAYTKKNGEKAYKFKVYVGKINGKSKYIEKQGFSTKAKARTAILSLQEEIDKQENAATAKLTFTDVYKKWLVEYERNVINSTYYKTKRSFENHVLDQIGNKQIDSITPKMLQISVNKWCTDLKFGKKLVGSVKQVFNFAIRQGYIKYNPALSVQVPKIKREIENKKDFYNLDELKKFMLLVEKKDDIRKLALFRLLAFTGISKGELLALTWSDYYDTTLSINKAISRSELGLEVSVTKTKSSTRLISLDEKTCDILDEYHKSVPNSVKIFESENGGILSPAKPRKWFLDIIKGSDLSPITIHGFRHTHASLIFDSGMSLKQAQYRLGHSDLNTTMNIYTHITQNAKDGIGEMFSNFVDF